MIYCCRDLFVTWCIPGNAVTYHKDDQYSSTMVLPLSDAGVINYAGNMLRMLKRFGDRFRTDSRDNPTIAFSSLRCPACVGCSNK